MSKISTVSIDEVEPYLFGFNLVEEIGRGAFATTFKATRGGQTVAIKILDPLRANMARKEPEICALQKLDSPYIVKLFETGSFIRGKLQYPYLVCEYVEGIELEQEINAGKIYDNSSLVSFSMAIGQGLEHMWEHKIIHRDLKPANIMLGNKEGVYKIIDFGFARHLGNGPKDPKNSPGTPLYMAPEQIKVRKEIDIRADLFALGIILYQLSSGIHPFETEDSVRSVKKNVCTLTPPLPSNYNSSLDQGIEKIIMKLLRKKRARRFQNPKEFLVVLRSLSTERSDDNVRK